MKYLLARRNRDVLAGFAASRGLVALDYDGTLAPIVVDRDQAHMRDRTKALLAEVCRLYPCAVISGRSESDVRKLLGGVPVSYVIGNHGIEIGGSLSKLETATTRARRFIEKALSNEAWLDIEDKRSSLTLHYRRAPSRGKALRAIEAAAAKLPVSMRTLPAKCALNLIPESAGTKANALLLLRDRAGADTALFAGDDVTDEDVFRLGQPGLTTVRIGRSAESAAAYYLRKQTEIDQLLRRLVHERSRRAS
jgi:trehalose 6-phosphate phosphatase